MENLIHFSVMCEFFQKNSTGNFDLFVDLPTYIRL